MLQIQAMYFDSNRCYAGYSGYARYCVTINTDVFPGKMCSDPSKIRHGCDRKNYRALVLLGLASGPLPNAVNSSVVPLPNAVNSSVVNFSPSTKKIPLSILLNFFF